MERSFLRIEKRELFDPQWICEELIDENRGCIKEEYQGQKGYLRFVKERFGQKGSMSTIFDKVSKTFKEDSIKRLTKKTFYSSYTSRRGGNY